MLPKTLGNGAGPVVRSRGLIALACVLACLATLGSMGQQSGQSPVFRSGVDLLTLDVTVVNKDGAQIRGLAASDFVVKVDGHQRAIRALDYQVFGASADGEASSKPTSSVRTVDSPGAGRGGRIILILFDDLSAKPGDAKGLIVAAERVLGLLGGDDLVGIVTTSGFGPVLSPTRDRAALAAALHSSGLVGRYDDSSGPFFVTVKEAMDTVDAQRGVLNGVVSRECVDSTLGESCRTMVEAAANRLVALTRRRADAQIDAFKSAIEALRSVPKPRILLALSSGLAFGAGRSLQGTPNQSVTRRQMQAFSFMGSLKSGTPSTSAPQDVLSPLHTTA